MLPYLWLLIWSSMQSCCRGYEFFNTTDTIQLMLKGNIAHSGQFPIAAISLKRPTFQVKGPQYAGNVGDPYGSNIIEVSAEAANQYKYVVRFEGPRDGQKWTVALWNNMGPDGHLGGWLGNACRTFTLNSGQVRYIAFDDDSHGGWAAAPGLSIPIDEDGRYAATWGEFSFGSLINFGRSAFVVSTLAKRRARKSKV